MRTICIAAVTAMFVGAGPATAQILIGGFAQPDGYASPPWNTMGGSTGSIGVVSNALTANADAGIFAPLSFSQPIQTTFTLTQENGFGGLLYRYNDSLYFKNDGNLGDGYQLSFGRGDQNYDNSSISLAINGTNIGTVFSSFQFQASITPTVAVSPDGSVQGYVTDGSNTFNFSFGPNTGYASLPGTNFGIELTGGDSRFSSPINSTLSSLTVSSNTNVSLASTTSIFLQSAVDAADMLSPNKVITDIGGWLVDTLGRIDPAAELKFESFAINPNLKSYAQLASLGFDTYNILDTATSVVSDARGIIIDNSKSDAVELVLGTIETGLGATIDNSNVNTDIQNAAKLVQFGLTAESLAASCKSVQGCLAAVDGYIWTNLVANQVKILADDPPDPNYTTVFQLPSSLAAPSFATSDPSFNALASLWAGELEAAGAYALAANISLNRYSSALAAGDSTSAMNQLHAFIYYLDLYQAAMTKGASDQKTLFALPVMQALASEKLDVSLLLELQQRLEASGFSVDEIAFLHSLGETDADIESLKERFVDYQFNLDTDTTVGTAYSYRNDIVSLAAGITPITEVPEPMTLTVFGAGFAGALALKRKKRRA